MENNPKQQWCPEIHKLFLRSVTQTEENRLYQQLLDEAVEAELKDFDFDRGLLFPTRKEGPTQFPDFRAEWPMEERHRLAGDPGCYWYYGQGRGSAALLGQMAFCYRNPLSRYHRSERFLNGLRQGFRAYREHQLPSGEFAFCPVRYATIWGTHEMAWRLEPLLYASWWMGGDLPEEERAAAEAMLRKGAEFLLPTLCDDPNNRGCVWSAIIQLCGLWLGDERFLDAARRVWNVCKPNVLTPSGQVTEQGGPDANYSYTAFSYVFLYRLYSGDESLDDPVVRALQWFTLTHTRSGYPFEGTSTRKRIVLDRPRADLLPALILYSRREPYFRVLAAEILEGYRRSGRKVGGHMVSPLIWMMLLGPEGQETGPAAEPEWHRESFLECRTELTRYWLIRRHYQTSVTMRSLQPMKGLQTWAFGDEPPIVHPGMGVYSGTRAWGLNTASMNVSTRPMAANFYDYLRGSTPAPWLSVRQENLWTHHLFTPDTTLVILDGETGQRITSWTVTRVGGSDPQVLPGVVEFPPRRGRLYYVGVGRPPSLKESSEAGVLLLEFTSDQVVTVFAFSNESFRIIEDALADRKLEFEDASGRYAVEIVSGKDPDPHRSGPAAAGLRGT